MILRQWIIACFVLAAAGFTSGAIAQSPAPQGQQPAAAAAQPAKPAAPKIDTAEITKRVNESVGVDVQALIKGWQKELDRIEEALRKPNLSYSDLNGYRDGFLSWRTATSLEEARAASECG